ncbi:MAG TPA: M56 family metallopeptidase [Chitinophagaceae bacterium]|nr:M56 family metallopeptidase [Chitinophagaceae bacterium]
MHTAFINNVFAGKMAEALCWMLVHSLWQGLLFTIITGVVMLLTKKSSALLRYNIMCLLLGMFLAVCAATFFWQLNGDVYTVAGQQTAIGNVTQNILQGWLQKLNDYFKANAGLVLIVWLIVFLAKCVKMTAGLVYGQRVRHHKTHMPGAAWQQKMAALCRQLGLKGNVLLLESEIVKIPVVIGHLKPIVFIPLGLLTSLPAGEIEAVLLHELAHIRRNDYFVNILQVMAENVFFFNPALLWMSSIIREEREHCCDDIAVAQTKSKKQFIQALISFKEHAMHTGSLTTAFPAKKNQLLQRVSRIINSNNKTLSGGEKIFLLASLLLIAGLSLAVSGGNLAGATKARAVTSARITTNPAAGYGDDEKSVKQDIQLTTRQVITNNNIQATHKKPVEIEMYRKVITKDDDNKFEADAKQVKTPNAKPALTDGQQAELDKQQADKDRIQADKDRMQADLDRKQADADRVQAIKDREQADLDKIQADRDRKQAEADRQQAEKARLNPNS